MIGENEDIVGNFLYGVQTRENSRKAYNAHQVKHKIILFFLPSLLYGNTLTLTFS